MRWVRVGVEGEGGRCRTGGAGACIEELLGRHVLSTSWCRELAVFLGGFIHREWGAVRRVLSGLAIHGPWVQVVTR